MLWRESVIWKKNPRVKRAGQMATKVVIGCKAATNKRATMQVEYGCLWVGGAEPVACRPGNLASL
ncbi:hypothetical protein AS19_02020 [Alcanivorax sp. NBRC 101098]|nr:hypothetical protein AS19_02020 [Alcanivorax sp. NBRC 101098]